MILCGTPIRSWTFLAWRTYTSPCHISQFAPRLLCVRKRRSVPTLAILSNYSVFSDLDQKWCISDRNSPVPTTQCRPILTPLFRFLADLLCSKLYNVYGTAKPQQIEAMEFGLLDNNRSLTYLIPYIFKGFILNAKGTDKPYCIFIIQLHVTADSGVCRSPFKPVHCTTGARRCWESTCVYECKFT